MDGRARQPFKPSMTTSGIGSCGCSPRRPLVARKSSSRNLGRCSTIYWSRWALKRPGNLPASVYSYVDVRGSQERRHNVLVTRTLEGEVRKAWTRRSSRRA